MKRKRSSKTVHKLNNSRVTVSQCRTGTGHPYFTLFYREVGRRRRETFADNGEIEARAREVLKALDAGQFCALELSRDDVD